jgi:hypothetical protein
MPPRWPQAEALVAFVRVSWGMKLSDRDYERGAMGVV